MNFCKLLIDYGNHYRYYLNMYYNLLFEIKRRGLSQREFAKEVNINENLFSRKMHSKAIFSYAEIKRIINFFNAKLSFDYLFEESC